MIKSHTIFPSNKAALLKFSDLAAVSSSGIVSRAVLQTVELRVVHFVFDEGQELTEHSSPHRALVQILEGACDFLFDGKWQRLDAGSLLHMPPNHPHALKANHGPFSMLLTLGIQPKGEGGE